MSGLEARVCVHRATKTIDVQLSVPAATTVALLGPNGAGKSTVVSAVSGLIRLDEGCITVEDTVWDNVEHGVHLAPQARRVGVVFQDLRLFPWLDAIDNVAYPLRRKRVRKREAQGRARDLLGSFGLNGVMTQRVDELSGGEAQRVALARAIVTKPSILLLDEPLSDLDVTARADVRSLLRDYLSTFDGSTVLVTHDRADAGLADNVVLID
jgi:molybdate transport system ATP-binding protein